MSGMDDRSLCKHEEDEPASSAGGAGSVRQLPYSYRNGWTRGAMSQVKSATERQSRRKILSGAGLMVVLFSISAFAVWTSQLTAGDANDALAASRLSDDYAEAATAINAEESTERKYRLEPGPTVETQHAAAADGLLNALYLIENDGAAPDREIVGRIRVAHESYLTATESMFRAVDRGDAALATSIDSGQVDPVFTAMARIVKDSAATAHERSLNSLDRLRRLESFNRGATPLVFLLGLMLAGLLTSVGRGYRSMLVAERAQAIHDSLHDSLTGLPSRTLLIDRLTQAVRAAHRDSTTAGLLLIDLDRFKEINDTFGHHYGDLLLGQIGPRLTSQLREVDTVARLGGDEFAILLPSVTDQYGATVVADKILDSFSQPFRVAGIDVDIEASIGIVVTGQPGETSATMLQHADIAMYVAKAQNLGSFVYDPSIDTHSPAKLALLGELRRALDGRELLLHYQPKVAISTGEVVGVEALIRWQHPDRGMVFPDDFIPLAEHTGLIGPLTEYVIASALEQAKSWADGGRAMKIAVNLSARNLLDKHLPATIAQLLADHGVPAQLLQLEITESALLTEPGRAQILLNRLTDIGVTISVDDFGTGYTSLGQLKDLPVTELKIDRSFVMPLADSRSDALIVQSVIDLGHNLGMTIVAEGVENPEALAVLAGFGCDIAQGYHLSRPMAATDFDRWSAGHDPAKWAHRTGISPGSWGGESTGRNGSAGNDHRAGTDSSVAAGPLDAIRGTANDDPWQASPVG